jgi:hypothetical protein
MSHKAAIEAALMLSPRSRLIQQDGRTRLLIEMFPYSTAVLADNENFRLTVSVTATSPLIEAHDAVRPEVGTSCPTSLVAPYHPTAPAPTMAGATKLFATTIDIRDMTKGKLSEAPLLARSIRLSLRQSCAQPSQSKCVAA